jgi:RNase P/RNase MRP subunit p29
MVKAKRPKLAGGSERRQGESHGRAPGRSGEGRISKAGEGDKRRVLRDVVSLVSEAAPEIFKPAEVVSKKLIKPLAITSMAWRSSDSESQAQKVLQRVGPIRGSRFAAAKVHARGQGAPLLPDGHKPLPLDWDMCMELHKGWRTYAVRHLAVTGRGLAAALVAGAGRLDWTFAYIVITRCSAATELCDRGFIVLRETRRTLVCMSETGRRVVVPKAGTWFALPLPRSREVPSAGGVAQLPVPQEGVAAVLEVCGDEVLHRGGGGKMFRPKPRAGLRDE